MQLFEYILSYTNWFPTAENRRGQAGRTYGGEEIQANQREVTETKREVAAEGEDVD